MKKTQILGGFLLAGLCTVSAWAKDRDAVVGAGGEIYVARQGAYGELFPNASPAEAADPILALDIIKPDGAVERQAVPGTRNTKVASAPVLVYEDDSRTVFLVWENRFDDVHSVLTLAAFNGSKWTGPIELTGRTHFSPKAAPQIAITRDSYKDKGPDGSLDVKHRTILHLLWEEEIGAGEYATFYTPVILEDGVYLKGNPLYNLNQLTPAEPPATAFDTAAALVQSPALQNGRDGRAVVAAFASAVTRRIYTIEVDVLPHELSRLAGKTRSVIIDLGARYHPANLRALADQTKAFILAQETEFQPEIIQAIAERAHTLILNSNHATLAGLAEATRSVIIDLGGRLLRPSRTNGAPAKLAEIPREDAPLPPHLLQFRLASSRPAPRLGSAGAELKIFTSETGEDLLIAWTEGERVRYRESVQTGWTEIRETKLSDAITKERAYEILEQRIRNR